DDLDVGGDLAVGERGQDPRELLRRMDQVAAGRVQLARSELGQHARLVLGASLGEHRGARGEPIDDDDRESGREGQRGRGEGQEDLQAEGEPAAPGGDEPRDGQGEADEEDECQQGEKALPAQRHGSSLSRYPTPRTVSRSFGSPPASSSLRRSALTWTSTVRSPTTTSLPQTASRSWLRSNTRPGALRKAASRL